MRFNFVELSGAFGDLGTFLPLAAGMAFVAGMDLGLVFIFAGLANLFAGVLFGLPIGVQPMKAIAAVAIAESLLPGEIAAAGIVVGVVMLVFGLTRLADAVERLIPMSIVRGIQLGIGIKLMLQAFEFVAGTPWIGFDSVTIAAAFGVVIVISHRWAGFPGALLLFIVGLIVAFLETPGLMGQMSVGPPQFDVIVPTQRAWVNGFLFGAVPQIPLTILNSVIAVCVLSGDLFPGRKIPAQRMSMSVGLINLVTCWFGAIPMCHGSGGLAAQYHFGARTGGSVVMLGILNLIVGVLFGTAAALVIFAYPRSILGVLLLFAGLELALPAREQGDRKGFAVLLLTSAGIVAINTLAGFAIGIAVHFLSSRRARHT
jgi:MFS superfamily sulfate permease-like transporter